MNHGIYTYTGCPISIGFFKLHISMNKTGYITLMKKFLVSIILELWISWVIYSGIESYFEEEIFELQQEKHCNWNMFSGDEKVWILESGKTGSPEALRRRFLKKVSN